MKCLKHVNFVTIVFVDIEVAIVVVVVVVAAAVDVVVVVVKDPNSFAFLCQKMHPIISNETEEKKPGWKKIDSILDRIFFSNFNFSPISTEKNSRNVKLEMVV